MKQFITKSSIAFAHTAVREASADLLAAGYERSRWTVILVLKRLVEKGTETKQNEYKTDSKAIRICVPSRVKDILAYGLEDWAELLASFHFAKIVENQGVVVVVRSLGKVPLHVPARLILF